ncbi:BF3164 family lipoprotein [Roseivirga pacifica]|uniref:BF3164 family lipoprotein n=1 Tax=Roseivirga pacifica TaxID=1267423 RepID=UPI003BAC0B32
MKIHTLLFASFAIALSCTNTTKDKVIVTPTSLTSKVVFDDVGIGKAEHILFQANKLVVTKNLPEELILVYDLASSSRTTMGQYGDGPGEIRNPWSLQKSKEPDQVWVASIGQKMLSKFNIASGDRLAEEQIKLKGEATVIMEPLALNDSLLIGSSLDGKSIFTVFNREGEIIERLGDWSEKTEFGEYPAHVVSALYEGRLRTNGNQVLYSCIALDRFMLLDLVKMEMEEFQGPFHIQPEFGTVPDRGVSVFAPSPDTKFGFIDSFLSDDYVYLLYSGLSPKEITQTGKMANDLLVYDLKGNLVHHFLLDVSLKAFSIDENTNTIYGLTSYVNDDARVVRFQF